MNIVFPDRIDFDDATKAKIKVLGITTYNDVPTDEATVIERIRDAELITANFVAITRRVIDAAPRLKFIVSSAVGYNHIDYQYALSKDIKVLNCPTQNANAVAEHAIALMLAVSHKVLEANTSLREGKWNGLDMLGTELGQKKLGLVGYGRVGKLIERKVAGFNMTIRYVNSTSTDQDLDILLQESDIVCLCLTLDETTRHIINQRRLLMLKPHAILINIARGAVIDQAALLNALKQKTFCAAGLDVYENEPTSGHVPPDVLELVKLPNVVATPHIAYNTEETTTRLGEELFKNIESCLNGRPKNIINIKEVRSPLKS